MRALLVNVGHGSEAHDDHPRHNVAPLDLAICASILEEAGHRVDLWDTAVTPGRSSLEVAEQVRAKAPELVIVRPLHGCNEPMRELLRAVGPHAKRLLMGPSAAQYAKTFLHEGLIDGAFIGEPELTLMECLPHLAKKRLPKTIAGLQLRGDTLPSPRGFNDRLDELPFPAHHLLNRQGYQFRYPLDVEDKLNIGYVLSSRGCALKCVFCAPVERETFGTKYRWRSAKNIVDELEWMRNLGTNAVYFVDDFFGFSKPRIKALCEEMIRRDVVMPWAAQVRAQGLDLGLLKLMRQAGCSTLCFGAESGSDRMLKVIRKGVTTKQIRTQAQAIHEAGIQLVGYFIVGSPDETESERQATYDLIEDIQPDVVQIHIFNVFPGAPAMELYPELHNPTTTKFTGPGNIGKEALDAERRRFYRRYYLRPGYLGRTLRRRWRPMLANLDGELDFVKRSVRFFAGNA
jgi:anaerobic magnesium-protoporphyrin IX monomethyl ester cyclase